MPLQLGDSSSPTGWRPVPDLRSGGNPVDRVVITQAQTQNGQSELTLWRRLPEFWGPFSGNAQISAPEWALYADVVLLGAGGGGSGGNGGNGQDGNGGYAGKWALTVWAMAPGRVLQFAIGQGGNGGSANNVGSGGAGGETKVTVNDREWVATAAGGAGGSGTGNRAGQGVSPYSVNNSGEAWTLSGGGTAGKNNDGNSPGGGGGPGAGGLFNGAAPGRRGGNGAAWVRFRSA